MKKYAREPTKRSAASRTVDSSSSTCWTAPGNPRRSSRISRVPAAESVPRLRPTATASSASVVTCETKVFVAATLTRSSPTNTTSARRPPLRSASSTLAAGTSRRSRNGEPTPSRRDMTGSCCSHETTSRRSRVAPVAGRRQKSVRPGCGNAAPTPGCARRVPTHTKTTVIGRPTCRRSTPREPASVHTRDRR